MGRPAHTESDIYAIVVGRVVAELRDGAGLTQSELAERVGVNQTMISRIERGKAEADTFTLKQLAKALDMPHATLVGKIDKVYARAEEATRHLLPKGKGDEPWWSTALKVAGIVGIGGVIAFTVASVLKDDE